MTEPEPPAPAPASIDGGYRLGYRSGFVDGYDAAKRAQATEAPPPADKGSPPDPGKPPADTSAKDGEAPKDEAGGDADKPKPDAKPPLWKRPGVVLLAIVVLLALVIGVLLFWRHSREHEKTDDAFIDGTASRIAALAGGRVLKLYVNDNQVVKAGDPLVDIDAADIQTRVDQARAQVLTAQSQVEQARTQVATQRAAAAQAAATTRQAEAESTKAAQDLARFQRVDPDAVARQQTDAAVAAAGSAQARLEQARAGERAATAQIRSAEAQVKVAEANVETARAAEQAATLQLAYTHVVAPAAGRVTRRSVDVGNVISVGQPILSIVGNDLWVTANYKETQLTAVKVGQAVDVKVDAFPDLIFKAHVDSIQRGTGGYFSLLPAENATGNYVKVVQRVPVKIVFDQPDEVNRYPIGPGMSVTPDVHLQ